MRVFVCWRWGGAGVCVDRMRGQRGTLPWEQGDEGPWHRFFFRAERGGYGGGLAVGVSVTGSQRKENSTVLTRGYLVTLSSSVVIVLGIVLKPPIHSSHRAKSTTAKALRIQRNA